MTSTLGMFTVYSANFTAAPQPQPFPLQGSKRLQVPIINRLLPLGCSRLIEPFCGSAAVSIGARYHQKVETAVISDSNLSLMTLWQNILTDPEDLANRYANIWAGQLESSLSNGKPDTRDYFNVVRDRYNNAGAEGEPADFLFLLNKIVKAALRYSRSGRMNQSADGRRLGAKPSTVRTRLMATSAVLHGSSASCRDYADAIAEASIDDVIYLDPPYQGTTETRNKRYISGLSVDDFEEEVRRAVDRDLSLIISYDALKGKAIYGRPLDPTIGLLPLDIITGMSAQGTLLGRKQEAHETIYLSPALVERLGGTDEVFLRISSRMSQH
jgi:DNA adenine methylase